MGLTLTACGGGGGGSSGASAAPNNDIDGDGIINTADNCKDVANPGQSDLDGGGVGDVCDTINDNDTDGTKDAYDVDADGDGLIEIRNATALNAMRNNLRGTGLDMDNSDNDGLAGGDATGCGGSDGLTACNGYELTTNIDLNDLDIDASGSNWQPISSCEGGCLESTTANYFGATFNGNHHTISNMKIIITENYQGIGFFGAVTSNTQLRNIHLRDLSIRVAEGLETRYTGGLVGYASSASIVSSSATVAEMNTQGSEVGGLAGNLDNSVISSSYVIFNNITVTVYTLLSTFLGTDVGGFVGRVNESQISNSYAVGGVIEFLDSLSLASSVGELGGTIQLASTVNSSYAVVDEIIIEGDIAGGLLGSATLDSLLNFAYALTNQITSSRNNGGLVGGSNPSITVTNSYWNTTTELLGLGANPGESQTLAQLRTPADFTGADNIYAEWANAYCDPATGEYRESANELTAPFIRAWDLDDGNAANGADYPALNCLRDFTPAQQRLVAAAALAGRSPVDEYNRLRAGTE